MNVLTKLILLFLATTLSTFTMAQLPWTENFDSYTAGSGVDGTGNLADYPGSVTQWTITNTGGLANNGDYLKTVGGGLEAQDVNTAITWTTQSIDISACTSVSFSLDITETGDHEAADYANVEYSIDGGGFTLITNWNGNGDGTHTLIGDLLGGVANDADWGSETVTQTGLSGTSLVIRVTLLNNAGSEQIILDNVSVTGTGCAGGVTITTGAVTGAPFTVDCDVPTTDNGTVAFTTVGTFTGGNVFTAQLSDASGSFASPIAIGTLSLSGVDPSGNISITIPSDMDAGAGYLIRIISDSPAGTGSNSAAFTINQTGACAPSLPSSQGLLINEFSNGPSGSQEYYEFVVAGQCGDIVDIRGYILDDNNGTFSTSFPSTSGIAPGHLQLTNDAQWAAIPVGSLIVIYNADDVNPNVPADDLTDTNNDSLYVIPHNNTTYFNITTTLPDNNVPDSTYTPVTFGSTSWSALGLRNSGDAIQVRAPDGTYWHGVSYGGAEITGGPNNMKISTSGLGGSCGWFTDGDYLDAANWSTGAVGGNETPGTANNAANLAWLRSMRNPLSPSCPVTALPVELIQFDGDKSDQGNYLHWSTASEENSAYFTLERSIDGKTWEEIHTATSAGNSEVTQYYTFIDRNYPAQLNYYRLTQVDIDGTETVYHKYVAIDNTEREAVYLVTIVNILGQEIDENAPGVQLHMYSDGTTIKKLK